MRVPCLGLLALALPVCSIQESIHSGTTRQVPAHRSYEDLRVAEAELEVVRREKEAKDVAKQKREHAYHEPEPAPTAAHQKLFMRKRATLGSGSGSGSGPVHVENLTVKACQDFGKQIGAMQCSMVTEVSGFPEGTRLGAGGG